MGTATARRHTYTGQRKVEMHAWQQFDATLKTAAIPSRIPLHQPVTSMRYSRFAGRGLDYNGAKAATPTMRTALYIALGIFGLGFLIFWLMTLARERGKRENPTLLDLGIGLVVNFFDALGIGSFATTTFCFKSFGLVRDEDIPGTLNVGVTLPAILEGLLYIAVVDVDALTLILTIASATVGASLGARVVSRWPKRNIQIGMGITLLITALFGLLVQFHLLPGGGDLLALRGAKLLIAVAATTLLGALMTLGIGFFAPCMMVTYLLGMNPRATFPIMMGAVAFPRARCQRSVYPTEAL